MTFKQWIENFWYHYKWHTIISLFLVFTLAVGITQCASKIHYDQTAVLYCDRTVSDNTSIALQKELEKRITDQNGDGEALFEVYNLSYDADSVAPGQYTYANAQKLTAVVATGDYVLYVVDEYGYQRLMLDDGMQLFETYSFLPHKDGTAWNWKGSPLQKSLSDYKLPENLYFCIRKVKGTAAESEDALKQADLTQRLIKTLMSE
jgi:hypothetical protein